LEVVNGGVDGLHAPAGPARQERPRRAAAPASAAAARLVRQAPRGRPDGTPLDSKNLAAGGRGGRERWGGGYKGRRGSLRGTGRGGGSEVETEQSGSAAPHGLLAAWALLLCGCGLPRRWWCSGRGLRW